MTSMNSRRLLIIVIGVCVLWTFMLHRYLNRPPYTDYLKKEILSRSYEYVRSLASEQNEMDDGPFTGHETAYDLKKTLAVLLQDMETRLEQMENLYVALNRSFLLQQQQQQLNSAVDSSSSSSSASSNSISLNEFLQSPGRQLRSSQNDQIKRRSPADEIHFQDLLLGKQEVCDLTEEAKLNFPDCDGKIEWMMEHWKSDSCYAQLGVDGTYCSIVVYLSETESFCPVLPFRRHLVNVNQSKNHTTFAIVNTNKKELMEILTNPNANRDSYGFIQTRISSMWTDWVSAAQWFHKMKPKRKKMKIFIYMGFLSKDGKLNIVENSKTGGPLGEYVQWSDVIASHFVLGHEMKVASEVNEIVNFLSTIPKVSGSCQTQQSRIVDAIFTDIVGFNQFKSKLGSLQGQFNCLFRILDTFGTEPKFNFIPYANSHQLKTPWGMKMLNPKQFFTLFPHTPDNSFMGFVVSNRGVNTSSVNKLPRTKGQKPIALVYGKARNMWTSASAYLNVIHEFFEVHATIGDSVGEQAASFIPKYVVNHGLLNSNDYSELLAKATVYVGLGFPYEGPGPLEAVAHNTIFLNPQFIPPLNRFNTPFFKDKPTERSLSSQHPYMSMRYGEPYSYFVNMTDTTAVRSLLMNILSQPESSRPHGYIPFEMTHRGMIQRVSTYLEHLNFCGANVLQLLNALPSYRDQHLWPPLSATQFVLGRQGDSCSRTCELQKRICEPTHFVWVNRLSELQERGLICHEVQYRVDLAAPAVVISNALAASSSTSLPLLSSSSSLSFLSLSSLSSSKNQTCILLTEPMLFSCSEFHDNYMRLCPCRDALRTQWALCKDCL